MAKKRKKGGVRWVGPAKLVAESQDSSGVGGGDANKHAGNYSTSSGPGGGTGLAGKPRGVKKVRRPSSPPSRPPRRP